MLVLLGCLLIGIVVKKCVLEGVMIHRNLLLQVVVLNKGNAFLMLVCSVYL
jgi:hypothetical protein